MPNRTPAQVNDHVNVQVQVSFPVNIEAAFRAQATRTVAFLVKHRARAYAKHPMMLETISPGLAAAAPETVIAMAKQLIETERQGMSRKSFSTFFDKDMLQLFDFELRPIDQISPYDRDAL
jgi:hypothetical protein